MNQNSLRKEAQEFANNQMYVNPHDCSDFLDEKEYMIEYLIAKILDKDPYKCFCDEEYPTRLVEDGTEICCECEKPKEVIEKEEDLCPRCNGKIEEYYAGKYFCVDCGVQVHKY